MILITGAAGKTGRAIIKVLKQGSETVRALIHRKEQISRFSESGIEVMVGDLLNPETLSRAMKGIRAVYLISPNVNPDELAIGNAVIQAAQRNNVDFIVFHSVLHPQIEQMPHHWQKLRIEESLINSRLDFTILQPTIYMQNIIPQWSNILQKGILKLPYGSDTCLSQVDLEDVAQIACFVLREQCHSMATYELVGTLPLTQLEIADKLSSQLEQPVKFMMEPIEEWELKARASGMGEYQVSTLKKMFNYYEQNGFSGNPKVLTTLLGREPVSLESFFQRIKRGQ